MVVDHVILLVPDAAEAAQDLRERHGLGSERGPHHDFAGTRNHTVPLEPPQYLEFLTLENREAAARTEAGRRVLACEARGAGGLLEARIGTAGADV
jgi:Glyoxalase-like domain